MQLNKIDRLFLVDVSKYEDLVYFSIIKCTINILEEVFHDNIKKQYMLQLDKI